LFIIFTIKTNAQLFLPKVDYGTGSAPHSVTTGDFNGDNILDLAVANEFSNTVSILLGNGDGTFKNKVDYGIGGPPTSITIGDFNGDGKPDLATSNYTSNIISVLINKGDGTGTFLSNVDYVAGVTAHSIITGDFNGDHKLDLAVGNNGSNTVSIFIGKGDGTFQNKVDYATGSGPSSIAIGDFNADGFSDLAVANASDDNVSILLGNGDGTFQNKVDYVTGSLPATVAAGDFNGDNKLDLAVANNSSNTVSVFIGNGDGTFLNKVDYATGTTPFRLTTGDFNGDDKPDLAVVNTTSNTLNVFIGNGDGTFLSKVDYVTGTTPASVTAGDFNGDNKPDLAVVNWSSNTVSIFINDAPYPCPNTVRIVYGGQTYHTVAIEDQCWLKENLNIGTRIDGSVNQSNNSTIEKYCYNDDPNNCATDGGFYQWNEAMQYVTTEKAQGICPTGWHIPTYAEFQTLVTAVSDDGNALKALGQGGGSGAGTNTSGFSALFAGYHNTDGFFYHLGSSSDLWVSTEFSAIDAYRLTMNGGSSSTGWFNYDKNIGFSIRCINDLTVNALAGHPVLTAIEVAALNYTENDAATAITSTITVSDVDDTNIESATVQITGNYQNGQDVFSFTNQNGITGIWTAATGTMSLSGSATKANYQTALRNVKYSDTSDNPSTLARTVNFTINDGDNNSNTSTRQINITAVNDAPELAVIEVAALSYTKGEAATEITSTIEVTDIDDANIENANIQITTNYSNGEDILSFTNQNGIRGTWDPALGKLTLLGSSSLANYQTALRNIRYNNTSNNPSVLQRTVSFTVNDGLLASNILTRLINIIGRYDISLKALPENAGTVSGGGTYNLNSSVIVKAVSNIGYEFRNWTENGIVVSTTSNYSCTVNCNRNLVANFQAIQYTLITNCNPIDAGTTSGSGSYTIGQNIALSETPMTSYKFVDWKLGSVEISILQNYTYQLTEAVLITLGLQYIGGNIFVTANFERTTTDVKDLDLGIPTTYQLEQNYPNPFNPSTTIRFGLPKDGNVRIIIYNILGSEIVRLVNRMLSAGYHEVQFDGSKFNSGIYFYKIEAEDYTFVKKMILMK